MLIGFRFQNFRSFLDEQAFGFHTSSPDKMHWETNCVSTGIKSIPHLSKTAVIFGANASGKSNFIAALETFRNLILHSTSYTEQQLADQYTPCLFRSQANEPTHFEVDVLIDQVRYRYNVSYDSHCILHERLLVYQTDKPQRWFERQHDTLASEGNCISFSPGFHGPREMWRKATRPAALFLTTAVQLNASQLQPLFQWFERHLDFVFPSKSGNVARAASRLNEERFKSDVLRLLRSVDIRVADVRVPERESGQATYDAGKSSARAVSDDNHDRVKIEFLHACEGKEPLWMRFDRESSGAHRLFGLFGPLIACVEQNQLLVVDDFDLNLHPLVARQVISFINDPKVSQSQLLLVSHNTALMDLSMLRRDEIWLIENNEHRASNLYAVSRGRPRKREDIAKNYLRGRYGAVPDIKMPRQ